jgi:hypothetical protein
MIGSVNDQHDKKDEVASQNEIKYVDSLVYGSSAAANELPQVGVHD